jgi:hypothetical protein
MSNCQRCDHISGWGKCRKGLTQEPGCAEYSPLPPLEWANVDLDLVSDGEVGESYRITDVREVGVYGDNPGHLMSTELSDYDRDEIDRAILKAIEDPNSEAD